jgi:Zn-dependent M28 family amino/carboxypeptidase
MRLRPLEDAPATHMRSHFARSAAVLVALCASLESKPPKFAVTPEIQAALDAIRPDPLRGDLSFLASDLLEGRNTPSRGLDIAAEYIASQFRGAGLEPGGDNKSYFQSAHMTVARPDLTGFELKLTHGEHSVTLAPDDVSSLIAAAASDLRDVPVFKLDLSDARQVETLAPSDVAGKIVLFQMNREGLRNYRVAARKISDGKPAAILTINRAAAGEHRLGQRLLDPSSEQRTAPRIELTSEAAVAFYASLKPGLSGATASVHIPAPVTTPVELHNVIGILRGSDPTLRDTAVFVTAHYDHLGEKPDGPGDRIYNGANDDGSGTVSVIEIARALSSLKQRPRRSIVFMTFFGEEEGLVGSNYYVHHPSWPLKQTIADVNLEQVGRTDSSEGPQFSNASVTGFDYSDITDYLREAGNLTGIKVYKHPRNDGAYFSASDNLAFAQAGVPAHTLCVAFEYPDYHAVGDEWQKIDYANMAKVDRAVALALVMLAESAQAPRWNGSDPATAPYRK